MDMDDYVFTFDGGIVQQFQSQIKMRHNGSIEQYISMPAVLDGENCKHVTFNFMYDFAVSACEHLDEVYLYMTSLASDKPFVNGPHPSSAKRVAFLQSQGDIFIIVDVDEEPSRMAREGGVLIYALNHDISEPEVFDELDFINTDDLLAAQGWTYGNRVFVGNAHLVYTNLSQIYRLAITELRNGVFFVDFKWRKGMREIQVIKITFLDLRKELYQDHLPMPNMAFFEGITVASEYFDPLFKYWDVQLIVTTRNFHIFQVDINFDQTGSLLYHKISKIFYRYGYFETSNYIKTFDGYFAIVQKLPVMYEPFDWLSKQVLTVYDTRERWRPPTEPGLKQQNISAYYMLGGLVLPKGRVTFDFNFTFRRNATDPFIDIGLLILSSRQAIIREVALHDHIQIVTQQGIKISQKAKFVAFNDYSKLTIPLNIVVKDDDDDSSNGLPGWAIALIVIGSITLAGLGGFIGWRLWLKRRSQSPEQAPIKKSLLEEQGQGQGEDNDDDDDDEDEDDDDGDGDDDDDGEQKQKSSQKIGGTPVAVISTSNNQAMSINRQTISSVGDQQATEPGEKPAQVQSYPQAAQQLKPVNQPKVEEDPEEQNKPE